MPNILRIDASSRHEGSRSRELTDFLVDKLLTNQPYSELTTRDLARSPIEHIKNATIQGYYTPPEAMDEGLKAATRLSDTLIDELHAADIIIIGTPIYNFTAPSVLKAYIDQTVRINKTFSYDGASFAPLLPQGKKACLLNVYGGAGYVNGGPMEGANFLEPYLKFVLNFIGIQDIEVISVEGTSGNEASTNAAISEAKARITTLVG